MAEAFTQLDAPGADREQTSSARLRSIQLLRHAEQFCSAEVMRNQAWLQGGRAELTQLNLPWRLIQRTVHKDYRFGCGDFLRHIRRPLVIVQYAHSRITAPSLFGPLRKKRPDTIILAQRVAAGKNQTSGRKSHAVIVLSE